jgi:hypothetical protein
MRFSAAAGVIALSFPSDSQFAGAERKFGLQDRSGQNHDSASAIGADRFGRRLGKRNRRKSGRPSSTFEERRDSGPLAVLKNIMGQQRAIEQIECDSVSDSDVDIGVLACGLGYYCQESEDSKLGGICVASATPMALDRNLQAGAFQAYCDSSFLCNCDNYDSTTVSGLVTCGPIYYCQDDCDPRLCSAASSNIRVYGPDNFTSFGCFEFIGGPYAVRSCFGSSLTAIYIDDVKCDYAARLPDLNAGEGEYCYTFDCTNTVKNEAGSSCAAAQLLPPQFYDPCAETEASLYQCSVCEGNSTYVSLLDTIVDGFTCEGAELAARAGLVNMDQCPTLAPLVQENCGCVFAETPANDLCSEAIPLTIDGDLVTGTIRGATADTVDVCSRGVIQRGVWYTLTGTGNREPDCRQPV